MFNNSGKAARRASALAFLSVAVIACSGNPPSSTGGGDGLGTAQVPDATDAPAGSDGGLGSAPTSAGSPGVVTGHVGDKLTVDHARRRHGGSHARQGGGPRDARPRRRRQLPGRGPVGRARDHQPSITRPLPPRSRSWWTGSGRTATPDHGRQIQGLLPRDRRVQGVHARGSHGSGSVGHDLPRVLWYPPA